MSAVAVRLACHLIEEHFGETVEKVCKFLLENGSSSLPTIISRTSVTKNEAKKSLCVMINHGIVSFEATGKKNSMEYAALISRCLLLARYPRFIYCAKMLYDDAGELIMEEILHGGRMTMSDVLQKVKNKLQKAVGDSTKIESSIVRSKFIKLVEARFLQRVPDPASDTTKETPYDPDLPSQQAALFKLPSFVHDIGTPRGKRKREPNEEAGQSAKRPKTEDLEEYEYYIDEDILWQANLDRFHQYFRDHEIVSAVAKSSGPLASEIVRTILRISEVTTDKLETATTPTSYHDIFRALPANVNIDRSKFDQYLKILTENQTRIVRKVSEAGGGMYDIDLQKGSLAVTLSCIESVVQERFGSKSHRIFKLLVLKKYLEHKQIESFALIPAKEAKELLYQMFAEGFVSVQELSKAPDHAPSRTYYPFFVNLGQVSLQLKERCCKTLANLISRRKFERSENKRLIDKALRVEVIAASFKSDGADASHIAEIEEMITPSEQEQLKNHKARMAKLETSELQLDELLFTLENFLSFQQRVVIVDKSKTRSANSRR